MEEIGHTTVNESITANFVTVGYLFISLVTFLITLGIMALVSNRDNQQEITP
jgi:hypothetical protein